ncbi:BRCT domain-containing protein At4g02110 [Neltuma alba]|uniref:BRCT domain-containing protein At4g02110 n=1 Tax=Neltuma alba TaxID=207710 RepID=UPI0010A4E4B9|nr:BRCT domain-containing protein At4g02110 [Prosopis alba]
MRKVSLAKMRIAFRPQIAPLTEVKIEEQNSIFFGLPTPNRTSDFSSQMLGTSIPSQVFFNIRFVLYGFDPINESKVRFKLVNGGGVDVGQYGPSCTHVVVGKLTYDDPICVAARNDGKTLVTALWVDHSVDIGMPVDATSVMYRPLRDLNGIPGAKTLVVCLTGYQRQDRDDIMTMVGLMGAEFSKPLVASKVTHLICYKFEGEKYELASRLQTIKLVNHRWLEDCLKDWVLLPEEKYKKSGYELEMMAEEAKDSEEEAEDLVPGNSGGRDTTKIPFSPKVNSAASPGSSKPVVVESNAFPGSAAPEGLRQVNEGHESLLIFKNENRSDQTRNIHHDVLKCSGDTGVSRHDASGQLPDTCAKSTKPKNTCVPDAVDCQNFGIPGNADSSGHPPDLQAGTSEYGKLVNDLRLTSESVEGHAHSDAKGCAASNSRKYLKRFSPSSGLNESLGNISDPSASTLNNLKLRTDLDASLSKEEKASESINFAFVEGSGKGSDFDNKKGPSNLLTKKRTIEASTKFKSKMATETKLSIEGSPLTDSNKLPEIEHHSPVGRGDIKDPETVSSKSLQDNAPKINGKTDIAGFGGEEVVQDGNGTEPHNARNDLECSYSSEKKSRNEESTGHVTLDLSNKVSDKLIRKSPRKKTVAKKCLGSRPKSGATAKRKGFISLNESTPQADDAGCLSGWKETALCDGKKLHKSSKIVSVETSMEQESVCKSAENANGREFQDEETEAPDDKSEYKGLAADEDNRESVNLLKKSVTQTEGKLEATHHVSKSKSKPPKEDTNGTKPVVLELGDSTSKVKGKPKGRKLTEGRNKKATFTKDKMRPEMAASRERKDETNMETMEAASFPAGKNSSSAVLKNNSECFEEVEKENRPFDGEGIGEGINIGNSVLGIGAGQAKISRKTQKKVLNSSTTGDNRRAKREAACFIVSGHRLQRKEFQQMIRRLKGRVCRDSHQWSYQATHFITPDPIRRTEKFFAAAASGRWILKTDYLTACSQEGKFLTEEPYEWHKSGLSEDGAINLEAPRRWRLLKEKTGHGAFYGMRIIVYGDCIVPPLDTLKRVVKAGDGTILATSPPYTRLLDTGIDYAIVSPGMPRVDVWVQEFLKHEIPCVLADYLVEYVCKPGISLEKHVLYGTHAWAERSFANLQRKSEEIIENPPEIDDGNDTACQVCGSRDRGDVMLICGDESGSVGCGVGIHIDCCDPPLKAVPEEDWFCTKCSETRNCSISNKKRKKGVLSSSKSK